VSNCCICRIREPGRNDQGSCNLQSYGLWPDDLEYCTKRILGCLGFAIPSSRSKHRLADFAAVMVETMLGGEHGAWGYEREEVVEIRGDHRAPCNRNRCSDHSYLW